MKLEKIFKTLKDTINSNPLLDLKNKTRYQSGVFKYRNLIINFIDPLSLYHEVKDIFESKIYHFESVNNKPNIIDAGGYIGISTLYFKKMYPTARITVFEPDPSIFKVLQENINKNGIKDVNAINSGLGKEEGLLDFSPDGADGGSCYDKTDSKFKVKIERLSNFIESEIDLLKMNIEGAEGDVFEEIEPKIYLVREIIFEYHCFSNLNQNIGKILNILDRNNFKYFVTDKVGGGIPVPFNMGKEYKHFNLVYAKNMNYPNLL